MPTSWHCKGLGGRLRLLVKLPQHARQ
jgi:hypothetical protein